ncbi:MAG: extracellular solute-binding protein, partial [Clostridia bacterium]|nr:extracellular solute-binding protein [Clostridia bacterium]
MTRTGRRPRAAPGLALAAAAVAVALAYLFLVWRPAQPGYTGGRPAFRPVALDPAGRYEVTLWDEDVPLPGEGYARRVNGWAEAFSASHPNIRVRATVFPAGQLRPKLAAALAEGRPPDVVAARADWPELGSPWLVPLAPYFARAGSEPGPGRIAAPDPGTQGLVAREDGAPAGLLRRLELWWWVVDGRALPQAVAAPGAFDLASWLGAPPRDGREVSLAVDADGVRAAQEVLAGAEPSAAGWTQAAELLASLRPLAGPDAFLAFVTGRVPILAGAVPPALAEIRARLAWAVPVAPPRAGGPWPVVGASGVYVFYQRPYAGAAHTEAAVVVADAFAAWDEPAVRDALGVLPGRRTSAEAAMAKWPEAWRAAGEWALAEIAAGHFVRYPPEWDARAASVWDALQPAVRAWATRPRAGGEGGPAGAGGSQGDLASAVQAAWAGTPTS